MRWVVLVVVVVLAVSCQRVSFRGKALDEPRPVPAIVLDDKHGRSFSFAAQRGCSSATMPRRVSADAGDVP
jgi:hypothetical protein